MSKAFTKEDDVGEPPVIPRPQSPLKAGERNYLTPAGAQRLREELERLSVEQRPALFALSRIDVQAKRELDALDHRISYLQESLRAAEVIAVPLYEVDRVGFGASVTVRAANGETTTYRLVGVDETDAERNWVSWQSPIGRALLNKKLGERILFRFPAGQAQLEIVKVEYA